MIQRDAIVFPTHRYDRRVIGGAGLRHAALLDRWMRDEPTRRLLWVRRVHPRKRLSLTPPNAAFRRVALATTPLANLYKITRYDGQRVLGRFCLEHSLPYGLTSLLWPLLKSWWWRPAGRRLLWVGDPKEAAVFSTQNAHVRIFDAMDDWSLAPEFAHKRPQIVDGYRHARTADLICANTATAARPFEGHPALRLLPNAAALAAPPATQLAPGWPSGARPILGLIGNYRPGRLDASALRGIVADTREAVVVHLGRFEGLDALKAELEASGRFVSLGSQPHAEVLAAYRKLAALIVPHPQTRYTQSQDRITVYDAMAAGLPVVGPPIPPLDRLAEWGYPVAGLTDWPTQLAKALGESPEKKTQRRAVMQAESWDVRWREFADLLEAF